jgi:3-keto-disaccharide hydrolase
MINGYTDTPIIPETSWHVHDPARPQPVLVTPGNLSEIAPVTAPSDAKILFDGSSFEGWENAKTGGQSTWKLENGYMEVVGKSGGLQTKKEFGSIQLHLEWSAPTEITGDGQGRGNSGVFLMNLYEIQVLDGWENPTYADGVVGGVYGQFPPLVNASVKPGQWQIYDIIWSAPIFEGEKLLKPAYLTLTHNGVVLHHHKELQGPTQHRQLAEYKAHPAKGKLFLQDHGDAVRFRNIWLRELEN